MKKLLFIVLATILVAVPVHSSSILVTNGLINCDGIICPKGSESCTVSKKTFGDLSNIKYIRLCADALGVPTETVQQQLPNPLPGTVIDTASTYGVRGRQLSEEEQKELEERIDEMIQKKNNYWKNWATEFRTNLYGNLRKVLPSFPPGFPFNNSK